VRSWLIERPNRILVIRGGALGDFILTLPAIRALREYFPHARLEILGQKQIATLAEIAGLADATRSVNESGLAGFFARDGDLAPKFVEYFSGFDLVVSYLFDPDQIFAANLHRAGVGRLIIGSPKIHGAEHAAQQLARPLEQIGISLDDPVATLSSKATAMIDSHKIAIHPGSGSETKNWSLKNFIELVRQLLAPHEKNKILLIGGEADADRLTKLRTNLPDDRIEFAENLPLPELAQRLQSCRIFLGHDSGVSHLAAAVGMRCLLLFGPTDPKVWAPLGANVRVMRGPSLAMDGIGLADVLGSLGEL
jgi:heptosyltransferase-3